MASLKTTITVNGTVPGTNTRIYVGSRAGATVTLQIPSGWSGHIYGIYFALSLVDPITYEKTIRHWIEYRDATSGPKTIVQSFDIDSYTRETEGWLTGVTASAITRKPTNWSSSDNGSTKKPSGMSSTAPSSGSCYIEYGGSGINCFTYLIYPYSPLGGTRINTVYLGGPRKILFKAHADNGIAMTDISLVYYIYNNEEESIRKEYLYSRNPNLFELRYKNSNGVWVNYTGSPSVTVTDLYVAFKTPDAGGNNFIDSIVAKVISGSSAETDESTYLIYKSSDKYVVYPGDTVSRSSVTKLNTLLSEISLSYQEAREKLSLPSVSTTISVQEYEKVKASQLSTVTQSWLNFYDALKEVFPATFNYNTDNIYLPQGGEVLIANENTPLSSMNGNGFNNLIWILKNLL